MTIALQLDWNERRQFLTDMSAEAKDLEGQALQNLGKKLPAEVLLIALQQVEDEIAARYGAFFREQAFDGLTSMAVQNPNWNVQQTKTIRLEQSIALDKAMNDRIPDPATRQKLLNVLFTFRTISWDAQFWADRYFSPVDPE